MKKTILTLCIGMIIGLLAGSVTGTFAAVGDKFEAVVAQFTVVVDGEVQVLEASPVAINDSTYMPLRAMANMLGKDVTYKADSRTIELTTPIVEVDAMTQLDAVNEQINRLSEGIIDRTESIIHYEKLEKAALEGTDNENILNTIRANLEFFKSEQEKAKQQLAELQAQKAALESTP